MGLTQDDKMEARNCTERCDECGQVIQLATAHSYAEDGERGFSRCSELKLMICTYSYVPAVVFNEANFFTKNVICNLLAV